MGDADQVEGSVSEQLTEPLAKAPPGAAALEETETVALPRVSTVASAAASGEEPTDTSVASAAEVGLLPATTMGTNDESADQKTLVEATRKSASGWTLPPEATRESAGWTLPPEANIAPVATATDEAQPAHLASLEDAIGATNTHDILNDTPIDSAPMLESETVAVASHLSEDNSSAAAPCVPQSSDTIQSGAPLQATSSVPSTPSEARAAEAESIALNLSEAALLQALVSKRDSEVSPIQATDIPATSSESAGAAPTDVMVPPPGLALRSRPPPKPAQYRSSTPPPAAEFAGLETPALTREVTSVGASSAKETAVNSIPPGVALGTIGPTSGGKFLRGKLSTVFWGVSLIVVFLVGMAFGRPSQTSETATSSSAAAVEAARTEAYAQAKAEQPSLPLAFDLAVPKGAKPVAEMLTVEPAARTRVDAVALGRHWSKERFDALGQLSEGLRKAPQQLDDKKVVAEVMRFMADRSTSRVVLEVLAEVATPRALDLLYEVWIGSKERNETTQLAEALLLAKDVRTRASGALNLCLNLREKPTQCDQVSQLVQTAIREGDRRAAMLLVNTGARVNCGPAGDQECIKCLAEPKDLRKAVHASVARPDPVQ